MFVDEVDIVVRAGRGGDGAMAFLREKYRPLGGPAGGDGGHGGSVVFQAHAGLRTLVDFRGRRILIAKSGQPGEGRNKRGRSAKNLLVLVPVGTMIFDRKTGEEIGDLVKAGQKIIVAKGGKGGRGNACFSTPTDRAPRKFEKGESGEERELRLDLRLLADVGLVGLPNAGKSTLIGAVSTARPKVADYAFTTLRPSVGVVRLGDLASFTMADIPGLIAMAHEGKGLGHQFLRHIRRTSVICHLIEFPMYIDNTEERYLSMVESYRTIRNELSMYDEELAQKPEVVVFTKADILPPDALEIFKNELASRFVEETGCASPVLIVSALRADGIAALLGHLAKMLDIHPERVEPDEKVPEYIDGEPPEGLSLGKLSMDHLDSMIDEESEEKSD